MGPLTVLCSIGTTHPWNVAGIGLDAKVCARLGARHVAVVAGVSAQGAQRFAAGSVAADLIVEQMRAVAAAGVDAYRIGALLSSEAVAIVADALRGTTVPIVCDPVLGTSKGEPFADGRTIDALRDELFARCTLVTPNLAEASRLCGIPVTDRETMGAGARSLVETYGARAALVTGGHLDGEATDVLFAGGEIVAFEGTRLAGGMRGTGCVLASAIAIYLGRGESIATAIGLARDVVREAIVNAESWNGERVWPW